MAADCFHGNINLQLSGRATTPAGVIAVRGFDMTGFAIVLVLTLCLTAVIRRTTVVQRDRLSGSLAAVFA